MILGFSQYQAVDVTNWAVSVTIGAQERQKMFRPINQAQWPLFDLYTDATEAGIVLVADRHSAARGYDLGTANGAEILKQFCGISNLIEAESWVSRFGFPWSADKVSLDDSGLEYGVLLPDLIERAASLSLLRKLVLLSRGKQKISERNVLAWPLVDSPLSSQQVLEFSTWASLDRKVIKAGKDSIKDYLQDCKQDLVIAFLPDSFSRMKGSWQGRLSAPLLVTLEPVENSIQSAADFMPVHVPNSIVGFENKVKYAARVTLLELLPRLIRGVVPSVHGEVIEGSLTVHATCAFPSPYALMAYEIYKSLPASGG